MVQQCILFIGALHRDLCHQEHNAHQASYCLPRPTFKWICTELKRLNIRDAEVEKGYLLAVQPKSPLYLYKAWNCRTILIPGRIGRMQSVFFFFFFPFSTVALGNNSMLACCMCCELNSTNTNTTKNLLPTLLFHYCLNFAQWYFNCSVYILLKTEFDRNACVVCSQLNDGPFWTGHSNAKHALLDFRWNEVLPWMNEASVDQLGVNNNNKKNTIEWN